MSDDIFSRRAVVLLVVIGTVSLLAGFAAAIFGSGAPDVTSAAANSFSSSALGHRALVELLEDSGRRVVRSRGQSARKAGDNALLLVLEPGLDRLDELTRMVDRTEHCLIALPKWLGENDPDHPGWVESVHRLDTAEVQRVLGALDVRDSVIEAKDATAWRSELGLVPDLRHPQLVDTGEDSAIAADRGTLLFRLEPDTTSRWVLTDPDILSNHGLGRGDNAELVLRILEHVAPADAPIVLDETLHGFEVSPNIWGELGRFPLVIVLAQATITLLVLVWSGAVRFGSPEPPARGLAAGKAVLIDNVAELLLVGGHTSSVLRRYFALAQRRIAGAYHLPPDLSDQDRRQRLRRIAESRGTTHGFDEIEAAVEECGHGRADIERESLSVAQDIRSWTKEMLDASR